RASGMVARRADLLANGREGSGPGLLLRAEAEKLVGELGDSWDWDESTLDVGRSDRVQRGSEVSWPSKHELTPGHAVCPP
ncbi:hypothetical protein NY486_03720, partial [Enterobacter hormaechei]|nr:hypothetical protein [Enterobacter hormaechei]